MHEKFNCVNIQGATNNIETIGGVYCICDNALAYSSGYRVVKTAPMLGPLTHSQYTYTY